jgi:hypothetical protein
MRRSEPSYNFFARIDAETEKCRRRLQQQFDCGASELVKRGFRKLEACLDDASEAEPPTAA